MTERARPLLHCRGLVVGHRGQALLPPIDLTVHRGEFIAVIGRNGSGKSTTFKTMLGLIPPVAGKVVHERGGMRLAYVPQGAALDPALPVSAKRVVEMGAQRGWDFLRPFTPKSAMAAARSAIFDTSAGGFGHVRYGELSEGQKQRTLFARMLVAEPDVALLDEPTAAMDTLAEREAFARLHDLAEQRGMAILVVSHCLPAATRHADRVMFIDRDDRQVVLGRPAEVFAHPAFRARFGDVGSHDDA